MNITLRKLEHVQFQDDTAPSQQTEGGPSRPEVRQQLRMAPDSSARRRHATPDSSGLARFHPDLSGALRTYTELCGPKTSFSRRATRILELAHRVSRPRFKFQALPIYSYLQLATPIYTKNRASCGKTCHRPPTASTIAHTKRAQERLQTCDHIDLES